jgi:NADPH:quinone reductase-like Zn-dependent oxidoreductase
MKAISVGEFGGPEVLKLEDVPDPRPPQSGEVLIWSELSIPLFILVWC